MLHFLNIYRGQLLSKLSWFYMFWYISCFFFVFTGSFLRHGESHHKGLGLTYSGIFNPFTQGSQFCSRTRLVRCILNLFFIFFFFISPEIFCNLLYSLLLTIFAHFCIAFCLWHWLLVRTIMWGLYWLLNLCLILGMEGQSFILTFLLF